jgi:hypothetical protein
MARRERDRLARGVRGKGLRGQGDDSSDQKTLQYSHFSPLSGAPDQPENYHTVTISLSGRGETTAVSLTQDNNPSEKALEESERNWEAMLDGLKKYVEGRG